MRLAALGAAQCAAEEPTAVRKASRHRLLESQTFPTERVPTFFTACARASTPLEARNIISSFRVSSRTRPSRHAGGRRRSWVLRHVPGR